MADFDPTPEERLLLAIFGLRAGETYEEALAEMRAAAGDETTTADQEADA